jgi:aspartate ammonia-lyase
MNQHQREEDRIPKTAYWGEQTQRAIDNFHVTGIPMSAHPEFVTAYAIVKQAAADANLTTGRITQDQHDGIIEACDEIINGQHDDQFPVDVLQGGAGTSMNMNMNEVIANIALERSGHRRGSYEDMHPNDTVNASQSTNDTYPTAMRLAMIYLCQDLSDELGALILRLERKADHLKDVVTIGRTQLQDAVPMTYHQVLMAYADNLQNDQYRIDKAIQRLQNVSLGGTAIGTGIMASPAYQDEVILALRKRSLLRIQGVENRIAATSDMSDFLYVSSVMKIVSTHYGKMADDFRLLASGPMAGLQEVHLKPVQAGSSIMPGKVNPVLLEAVDQVMFDVIGKDASITAASMHGQLQLNAFEPLILHATLTGLHRLMEATGLLDTTIRDLTVREDVAASYANRSPSMATVLIPVMGYDAASLIAKQAIAQKKSVEDVVKSMDADTIASIMDTGVSFDPRSVTGE